MGKHPQCVKKYRGRVRGKWVPGRGASWAPPPTGRPETQTVEKPQNKVTYCRGGNLEFPLRKLVFVGADAHIGPKSVDD